jgi:hypothetical protein
MSQPTLYGSFFSLLTPDELRVQIENLLPDHIVMHHTTAGMFNVSRGYSSSYVSIKSILDVLAEVSDDSEAKTDLHNLFWGYAPDKKEWQAPIVTKDPEFCSHDWHEVILFTTPQLRCRWCDISKSKFDTQEKKS